VIPCAPWTKRTSVAAKFCTKSENSRQGAVLCVTELIQRLVLRVAGLIYQAVWDQLETQ
jgi:hypothetical protein